MCPNYCNGHVFIYGLKEKQKERIGRWAEKGTLCQMIIPYSKEVKADLDIKYKYEKERDRIVKKGEMTREKSNELREKYPFKDLWHSWCNNNRGSKWDLCDCGVYHPLNILELQFRTARSPVLEVFKELSRKYKCDVDYDYDEGGCCFSGRVRWSNGNLIYHDKFDDAYYGEGVKCSVCGGTYDGSCEDDWADIEKHICFNCGYKQDEGH